jgi:hemerythrin superfamily protein
MPAVERGALPRPEPARSVLARRLRPVVPMNAIELLVKQHREMEAAFEELLEADDASRSRLFERAADLLVSHVLVEERLFYPAVKARRTEDILLESLEEHLSLKRVLADLIALPPGDEHVLPKLHVLEEQARHHHEEEEEHLFPAVKKLLSNEELGALGAQMEVAQAELLALHPRKLVLVQTEAAADV